MAQVVEILSCRRLRPIQSTLSIPCWLYRHRYGEASTQSGINRNGAALPGYSAFSTRWVNLDVPNCLQKHYNDVIMGAMASQITSLTIVYSTVYSGANQRKHQSSALLTFVPGIYRRPVNSPHKWLVTRKMFPFDDVIMFMHALEICSIPPRCNCSARYTLTHVLNGRLY